MVDHGVLTYRVPAADSVCLCPLALSASPLPCFPRLCVVLLLLQPPSVQRCIGLILLEPSARIGADAFSASRVAKEMFADSMKAGRRRMCFKRKPRIIPSSLTADCKKQRVFTTDSESQQGGDIIDARIRKGGGRMSSVPYVLAETRAAQCFARLGCLFNLF
ncbi:uncharacterized [Tachysurus ichikawai]